MSARWPAWPLAVLALLAAGPALADAEAHSKAGKRAFIQCQACHSLNAGEHRIGPSLFGVVDRPAGTAAGYAYSAALREAGLRWDRERLDAFLARPADVIPGNRMAFAGVADPDTRAALIDHIAGHRWPSEAQVALVRERRASFPVPGLVESVDWYTPLEIVPGGSADIGNGEPLPGEVARDIDALAERFESFALIVARDGRIVHERYWRGFGPDSRFDTASMAKTVLALALGIAVQDGAINSVDDKLGRYLPELGDAARAGLSLRSMLEMASGLRTPAVSDDPASPYWQSYFGDDLRASMAHWPLAGQPGEEFYYANANPQYLMWVLEQATGQRYAEYLSERLWAPLGAGPARLWLDRDGGSPRGYCCLQARPRDWLLVGELIRNAGRSGERQLVPAQWIAQMLAPSPNNPNYGWQIWRGSPHNPARTYGAGIPAVVPAVEPFAADDVVYLDGSGGQRVYVIPSAAMVIVRIGNPSRSWDDSALPNLLLGR